MKAQLRNVDDHGVHYTALMFCCPGCAEMSSNTGLHMVAVNSPQKSPSWDWDRNLDAPTLSPSILTTTYRGEGESRVDLVCHSFLKAGVFEFLGDCTHSLANQTVPMLDLPEWAIKEA